MSLTRDDMLKELELLPMWQLRNPAPVVVAAVAIDQVAEEPSKIDAILTPEPLQLAVLEEAGSEAAPAAVIEHAEPDLEHIEINLPSAEVSLGQGRRESIMQLDWQGLQDCVMHCEACSLSKTRTQTVFGVGDPNADWLIVGEAPGAEEDKQGEPFVGQAGKLLDNMLAAIQLKRGENVYIANVLKCRPPQNRDPQGEEVVQCDPFLKRQVELIKPKLIIALGKFAAQSLLASEATIASMRGRQHSFHGVPVIVTYHPAYLLRNLPDKAKAWEDLCMARELMQTLQSADASPSN